MPTMAIGAAGARSTRSRRSCSSAASSASRFGGRFAIRSRKSLIAGSRRRAARSRSTSSSDSCSIDARRRRRAAAGSRRSPARRRRRARPEHVAHEVVGEGLDRRMVEDQRRRQRAPSARPPAGCAARPPSASRGPARSAGGARRARPGRRAEDAGRPAPPTWARSSGAAPGLGRRGQPLAERRAGGDAAAGRGAAQLGQQRALGSARRRLRRRSQSIDHAATCGVAGLERGLERGEALGRRHAPDALRRMRRSRSSRAAAPTSAHAPQSMLSAGRPRGAAVVREGVEEGVGGGVVGLPGRAEQRGHRGEEHEEVERVVARQRVQVPGAVDLRGQDACEARQSCCSSGRRRARRPRGRCRAAAAASRAPRGATAASSACDRHVAAR